MKNKKWWFGAGAAVILLAVILMVINRPGPASGTNENLIRNGDFEKLSGSNLPSEWYTDAYFSGTGYTTYEVTDDGVTGQAAHITNHRLNDARFAQTVSVSPNTLYRLHGFVRANAEKGLGANLSIQDVYVFSQSVYAADDWQEVTLYGRTGENQHSVTVYVRLGGYSGEATGDAWFDDITLNRVDCVPAGYAETLWDASAYETDDDDGSDSAGGTGAIYLVIGCVLYVFAFAVLLNWLKNQKQDLTQKEHTASLCTMIVCLLMAFALRLVIAARVPGYDVDIGCFTGWSASMAQSGPLNFYQDVGFCDYPPGYMWVLWMLGGVGKLLDTGVTAFMVKLPPVLADMALCLLLYKEAKKYVCDKAACALSLLYAFNPLVLVTGAAWGQADAVMMLLLFLTVIFAMGNNWAAALPLYMAAVLVKPQALMFGPLGLAALMMYILKNSRDTHKKWLRNLLLGLGLTAATALVLAGPFLLHQAQPLSWLINLYRGTMSQYGYVTVNACNLYFLLGHNWVDATQGVTSAFIPLMVCVYALLPQIAACLSASCFKQENRLRTFSMIGAAAALIVCLLVLFLLGKLTYAILGTVMIVYCVALFMLLFALSGRIELLPLLGAGLLLALFNTGSMMHERYLFPAASLLLLSYSVQKDKRILLLALGVTLMGFLNVGCALDRNIRIGGAEGHLTGDIIGLQSDTTFWEKLSAAGNVLLGSFSLYLSAVLSQKGAVVSSWKSAEATGQNASVSLAPAVSVAPKRVIQALRPMTGKDWLIMLAATALYAVLAFTNLGSTKAPQTAYVSKSDDETIVFDLGEEKRFNMLFFNGIHWLSDWDVKQFAVQTSSDGENFTGSYIGDVKSGDDKDYTFDCFSWKYVVDEDAWGEESRSMSGRYVKMTTQITELTVYEILFVDADSGSVIPVQSITDAIDNPTLACMLDEQDTLEGIPGSWYNSTYFDEIYHARTAYEHLHGLSVYETTHPPLGKVLMSFFIAIFGMTPFGWRFAGALAGVLMLPGMYLLGKLLIRRKWGGLAAMALMAFDLMHFTQTRIATIDSFVVLFIIWSVYFMLRWFLLDYFRTPFLKTLVPLGLSGLCMGLAVASKWTGCYAGVGLAVLFFYGIFRRFRDVQSAREIHDKKRTEAEKTAAAEGWKRLAATIASCLIFFVAVPAAIYYASYIPYFAPEGGVTLEKVINAAEGMLDYHSIPGLGMNHSFYSPWYQWPVIGKPMWYYAGENDPAGMGSTIMALGNPAVWWTGLLGLFGVIGLLIRRHYDEKRHALTLYAATDDPRYALLIICFAAQYLPWMLVPRGTYIYHYFPSVPFIILCTALCIERLSDRFPKAGRIVLIALISLAAVLFVAFFPYASGVTVSTKWLDAMKWFPRWLWY